MSGHSRVKSWRWLPAAVVVRFHIDLHGNKVGDRYGFVLSLVRQVLVLIDCTLVLDLGRGSLKLACIIGKIQASFFLPECFLHLIEGSVNLLIILNLLPPSSLFLHLFPILGLLHLLE